jgi:hypothetical protein
MMWVALFLDLSCASCQPVEVGEFADQIACLRWVVREEFRHPKVKGKCERRPWKK